MPEIPGIDNIGSFIFQNSVFSRLLFWGEAIFIMVLCMALVFFVFHVLKHKFKAVEYSIVGSGTLQGLSVGSRKSNRYRWNKDKTKWLPLMPLFNKTEISPFPERYRYAGNRLIVFKYGEHYIPGCINIDSKESEDIKAEINPVPYSVRNWMNIRIQKTISELSKPTFWEKYTPYIALIATVGLCCLITGVTVYLTYNFAGGGAASMDRLAGQISKFTDTIGG